MRSLEVVGYATVKGVLSTAHYLGKPGATSVRLGMTIDGLLAGVITFGTIPGNNAKAITGPANAHGVLELTRLALYDWAPHNSESWCIGAAVHWLVANRPDVHTLISYADASVGHVGTIYQATNWTYTGKSGGDVYWLCDDGTRLHPRTTGWDTSKLPPGRWAPAAGKHRYVLFIGPQRRKTRRLLKWPALPYPKQLQETL